jgi:putative ABC transport system ATP-binding protein
MILQTRNLGKSINSPEGELRLLHDVELDIATGETVAVIGASGAGKSTLLGLLAGLDTPTEGQVFFDNENLFSLSEDGRARLRAEKVGFVFQSFHLLPHLTALENVMLPLELAGREEARKAATGILERVGLENRLRHYPKQLSGGEQQRVAIGRAFALHPKVLFADEPTGNLDRHTGKRIVDLLFNLNEEQGTTLILVTHDAHLAERCQRRLELDEGLLRRFE